MTEREHKKIGFLDLVWHYKFSLAVYIVSISVLTFIVLYAFGSVPEELKLESPDQSVAGDMQATSTEVLSATQGELPVRVIVESVGINAPILNTTSTNNDTLNALLLKGAVRYPASGLLGAPGNVFIFGHSTSFKIVNNKAYQTFSHLGDVKTGDVIKINSATKQYTYQVTNVSMVDSEDTLVNLATKKDLLTLSTCNVLGKKEQRFVVQAKLVGSVAL